MTSGKEAAPLTEGSGNCDQWQEEQRDDLHLEEQRRVSSSWRARDRRPSRGGLARSQEGEVFERTTLKELQTTSPADTPRHSHGSQQEAAARPSADSAAHLSDSLLPSSSLLNVHPRSLALLGQDELGPSFEGRQREGEPPRKGRRHPCWL